MSGADMEVDSKAAVVGDAICAVLSKPEYSKGISQTELLRMVCGGGQYTDTQTSAGINYLIQQKYVKLETEERHGVTELILILVDKATAERNRKLEAELTRDELSLYGIIEESGNMGIWSRELRKKSGLVQTQMEKTIKALTTKKLIKPINSVQSGTKKVYMLADLEPSRQITGGAWYSGQEFDSEFINVLREQCHQYIEKKGIVTLEEVCMFIGASKISQVELTPDEVVGLLETLMLDGRLRLDGGKYRPAKNVGPFDTFTGIPCAKCPVVEDCHDGGEVSPAMCTYFTEWLESEF